MSHRRSTEQRSEPLRVAVVIPAFRAADTIQKVLTGIPAWVDAIYVVDDASDDDTGARVREVADPRVELLVHQTNRGVGAAVVTGYRHALRQDMDVCVKKWTPTTRWTRRTCRR